MTRDKKGWLDTLREWLSPLAAVVAVLISVRACNQSNTSNETAKKSNEVAEKSNELAKKSNETAEKSFELAKRNASPDFLLETEPLGTDLRPGPLKVVARLKNVGTVTAFRVVALGRIDDFKATPIEKLYFEIPHAANQDLEPQHTMPVFFGPQFTLTPDDIAAFKSRKVSLTISVWVRSDSPTPGAERPDMSFVRAYDPKTGEWVRGFPGGNPRLETR